MAIVVLATAVSLFCVVLGERVKFLRSWKWHFAITIEGIGVLTAILALLTSTSDESATKEDVHASTETIRCEIQELKDALTEDGFEKAGEIADCIDSLDLMQTALDTGLVRLGQKRHEVALVHLGYAILSAPSDSCKAEAFFYSGLVLSRWARCSNCGIDSDSSARLHEESIDYFDKALRKRPNMHAAWINRGNALYLLGYLHSSVLSYDSAVFHRRNYHKAWYNRGKVLLELGQYHASESSYERAIHYKPGFQEAWNGRGVALRRLGRLDEALASYDSSIAHGNNYLAWYNKAEVFRETGHYQDAIDCCDSVLKYKPADSLSKRLREILVRTES